MKVIGFHKPLPISDPESFLDLNAEKPLPAARDLLVEIRAVGINPVDAKIRGGGGPGSPAGDLKILGWDAAGVVRAIGAEVTLFAPGDEVFYAGSVDRPGSYAEFQCVDERIVGRKPKKLGFAESAALIENPARPLDITKLKPKSIGLHWEFMFTRARFQTADMGEQGRLLTEVGELMDAGRIRTTLQANFGQITAENMRRAHAAIESGRTIGKIVLAGF
jgi:NADPH:quinone reductase-like Zn-dependent oxidoreductase